MSLRGNQARMYAGYAASSGPCKFPHAVVFAGHQTRQATEVSAAAVLPSMPAENLDALNWDAFDRDWRDSLGMRAPSRQAPTPVPPQMADQAAVDDVFAQAADEDLTAFDE